MRKFYASLLTGLACLTAFNASAYNVTLEVDNPAAVKAEFNGTPVTFTDGVAEIEYTSYDYVSLTAISPYVMAGFEEYYNGSWNTGHLNTPTNHYINLSAEYSDGNKYKVTTAKLDDLRTAHVTLKVDEPSAIRFMRSWTNETITPTENETVISYVPGKETPFSIQTVSGKNLYKLTVGDTEISGYYGQYSIYEVNDGDVIDVQVAYPDIKQTLKFNLSDKCQDGFITSVTVDGAPLENWVNAQVQIGSQVSVSFDSSNYNISKFEMNGTSIANYGYYYSPYSFIMDGDVTFDIEAAPYGDATMTFNVEKAEYVVLYKGYDSTDPANVFALNDGTTPITVPETAGPLYIRATAEAVITSVTQDGTPLSKNYNDAYEITVRDGSVIEVEAEEIRRDDTLVFYFDSPAKASDQSQQLYGYNFRCGSSGREIKLAEGYNMVNFGAVDGELMFTVYNGTTSNVFLYVNGEIPSFSSDYVTHYFTPQDGDVLKCYVGEQPATYSLTFDVDSKLSQPEVTVDKITKLSSLEAQTVLPGTHVSIVPAAGDKVGSVKVGEDEISPVDGRYEFTVNNDAPVSITSDGSASVIGIETEEAADNAVYNMQGIRVNADKLPAGLYIINGKKVLVK